jgi:hypothetical protein
MGVFLSFLGMIFFFFFSFLVIQITLHNYQLAKLAHSYHKT